MIYCCYWKTSAWNKGNKGGNSSPHNCCLIIILRCSGRKFLLWLCEEICNNKHGWTPIKYLNAFNHNRTHKSSCNTLQKYYQLPILGTFDISGHMEKMNSLPNFFFWDIVKMLQTYYFEYFENAWSYPAVMIVSPCRLKSTCSKLWCSSAS